MFLEEVNKEADNISKLRAVLNMLGIEATVNNFEKRLKLQKIIYLLRLNNDFRAHLPYVFTMYVRGPYCPNLARIYYKLPENNNVATLLIPDNAIGYGQKIANMSKRELELVSTINEAIRINKKGFKKKDLVKTIPFTTRKASWGISLPRFPRGSQPV